MAYRDDVLALNPTYLWTWNNTSVDEVGANDITNTGVSFTTTPLCEDVTHSLLTNVTSDFAGLGLTATPFDAADRKVVCGWFRTSQIQAPPKNIYREGTNGSTQFNLVMWAGNNLMLDVVNNNTVIQAFSDDILEPNRDYHIFARIEGTAFGNKVELYVDGIKQSTTEPANGQLGSATLPARSSSLIGTTTNTEVGSEPVLLNACVNGFYNMWAFFFGSDAQLTDTEIRETLVEKGAIPSTTITSNSSLLMQVQLDGLANTTLGNNSLDIRVESESGGGDLILTADNIQVNPKSSINLQYTGTGTLTWINTNGSNISTTSTPNGGTINVVNPATLTLSPLIPNTEVRVYQAGTSNELAGIENSGTSYTTGILFPTVDIVIISVDYQYIRLESVDTGSGDVSIPIQQIFDRQYEDEV